MDKTQIRKISPEVLYSDGGFLSVDQSIISSLKEFAGASERKRCRLCFHEDSASVQQEMLIVMHNSSYVRPHRHIGKSETLTVIEGNSDALVFDELGSVTNAFAMSAPDKGGKFFYRMPEGIFHSLIFRSEWFVFLETTIGPFDISQSSYADWAPTETDQAVGHEFMRSLDFSTD